MQLPLGLIKFSNYRTQWLTKYFMFYHSQASHLSLTLYNNHWTHLKYKIKKSRQSTVNFTHGSTVGLLTKQLPVHFQDFSGDLSGIPRFEDTDLICSSCMASNSSCISASLPAVSCSIGLSHSITNSFTFHESNIKSDQILSEIHFVKMEHKTPNIFLLLKR